MSFIYHEESGFNFNKKLNLDSYPEMKLLSLGTRYKYMLVIYGVGLYSNEPKINNIYKNSTSKCLQLKFYRSVSYENMYRAFTDEITKRVNEFKTYSKELEQIYNIFKTINNIEYTDTINIVWHKNTLEIQYNDESIGKIHNNNFSKILFDCYLDENSVTPDLVIF